MSVRRCGCNFRAVVSPQCPVSLWLGLGTFNKAHRLSCAEDASDAHASELSQQSEVTGHRDETKIDHPVSSTLQEQTGGAHAYLRRMHVRM